MLEVLSVVQSCSTMIYGIILSRTVTESHKSDLEEILKDTECSQTDLWFFKMFYLFIWKAKRHKNRERPLKSGLSSLVHYPSAHNSQDCIKPKTEVKNSIQVSHQGVRDPCTWANSCCLSGALAESWLGSRVARTWTRPSDVVGGHLRHCLNLPYHHVDPPIFSFYKWESRKPC